MPRVSGRVDGRTGERVQDEGGKEQRRTERLFVLLRIERVVYIIFDSEDGQDVDLKNKTQQLLYNAQRERGVEDGCNFRRTDTCTPVQLGNKLSIYISRPRVSEEDSICMSSCRRGAKRAGEENYWEMYVDLGIG